MNLRAYAETIVKDLNKLNNDASCVDQISRGYRELQIHLVLLTLRQMEKIQSEIMNDTVNAIIKRKNPFL